MLIEACKVSDTPVIVSPKPCSAVIDLLRIYLLGAPGRHGQPARVSPDVLGMGVLITGESGVGKSELALELISRGHGLVADDVVEMGRIAPATVEGRCPGMLRDFLRSTRPRTAQYPDHLRRNGVRRKMKLKLIVQLQKSAGGADGPRLPLDAQTQGMSSAS